MLAHPAAEVLPLLRGAEYDDLVASIREHGLLEPITLHEGAVLDGRNRLRACEEAGIAPRFVDWNGEGGSPVTFAAEKNIHRRHLTPSQRAAFALQYLDMLEEEARERQRKAAARTNAALGRSHDPDTVVATRPEAQERRSRDKAAELTGASPRQVQRAKAIKRESETVLAEVAAGNIDIAEGARRVELSKRVNSLPPDERSRARTFLDDVGAVGTHTRKLIELADNLHEMPVEDRLRIYGLHESDDARQKSLAMTEAAKLPPMPNPALVHLREAARSLQKAESTLTGESLVRCQALREEIKTIIPTVKEAA